MYKGIMRTITKENAEVSEVLVAYWNHRLGRLKCFLTLKIPEDLMILMVYLFKKTKQTQRGLQG